MKNIESRRTPKHSAVGLLAALLCLGGLLGSHALAQESTANLADVWVFSPKDGHIEAFEAAVASHMAFRKEAGDTRAWEVWRPVTGENLNNYIIRYCCVSYSDMDAYVAWGRDSNTGQHFSDNVAEHVGKVAHYLDSVMMEHSNWPENTQEYPYVGVTWWKPKAGMMRGNITRQIARFHEIAQNGNFDQPYGWMFSETGDPMLAVVSPYKSYADMEEPEKTFFDIAKEQMESEEDVMKMFQEFSSSFEALPTYEIYRRDDDLSMSRD